MLFLTFRTRFPESSAKFLPVLQSVGLGVPSLSTELTGRLTAGLRLARLVGGLLDAGEGADGGGEADYLGHGGLLCTDVLDELVQSLELAIAGAAENPLLDVQATHALDDHLLDDVLLVGDVSVAPFLGALASHPTHVGRA